MFNGQAFVKIAKEAILAVATLIHPRRLRSTAVHLMMMTPEFVDLSTVATTHLE